MNHENEDKSAWAKLFEREFGEDENDGIFQALEQMETPTKDNGKSLVDNVVLSYNEIKSRAVT